MFYVLVCKRKMGNIPVAVEFRSSSWDRDTAFNFLSENSVVYCIADQAFREGVMPFVNRTTSSDIAYYRFHGRDASWVDGKTGLRHVDLYSNSDLTLFKGKIKHVAKGTKSTYICFNNCHAGASARNAKQMKKLLGISDSGNGVSFDLFD